MANSISVMVGESETIRSGLFAIRTSPLAAFTETGNAPSRGLTADVGADPPWVLADAHAEARRVKTNRRTPMERTGRPPQATTSFFRGCGTGPLPKRRRVPGPETPKPPAPRPEAAHRGPPPCARNGFLVPRQVS